MRAWLIRQLLRLVVWLTPPGEVSPLFARAKVLTALWEVTLGPGFGEAKRHNVFARLMKEFPEVNKRAIARAIEDALLP